MSDNEKAPIIIKRKKVVGGDGHHGGAWKVAYADFVTAMMAFFMLMWLLNATTESQRKGLADYFAPTIAIARISGGGDGAFGGDSMHTDEILPQSGTGGLEATPPGQAQITGVLIEGEGTDSAQLEALVEGLIGSGGESLVEDDVRKHINTRVTDEGLVIELFDLEGDPLFVENTAQPTAVLVELTQIMAELFVLVENDVKIGTHTRTFPVTLRTNPAWDLSTDRSHAQRRLLLSAGLEPLRVEQVIGFGQQRPLADNPMTAENNRIEITLLRE